MSTTADHAPATTRPQVVSIHTPLQPCTDDVRHLVAPGTLRVTFWNGTDRAIPPLQRGEPGDRAPVVEFLCPQCDRPVILPTRLDYDPTDF